MQNLKYLIVFILFWGFIPNTNAQQQIPKDSIIYYKVKSGENLYRIAVKHQCSVNQIKEWNNISNEDYIRAGQYLKIILHLDTAITNTNIASSEQKENKLNPTQIFITPKVTLNNNSIADTVKHKSNIRMIDKPEKKDRLNTNNKEIDLAFEGTRITERDEKYDSTGQIKLSGYISTYYAYYTDSVGVGNYQKFPTSAPVSEAFSLNMLMINAKYTSTKLRGNLTLHYGDIAASAWSNKYNYIQEANVGFKILKGVWFDAGYFRTHLGVESIQPRENITSSISAVTYYEPYYLSGAKLTFHLTDKFSLQVSAFNGFNTFVETNQSKAFGFSAIYDVSEKLSLNFNTLYADESPDEQKRKQKRLYNNFYLTYKSKRFDLAAEANYGVQENSVLTDTTASAFMYSALLVTRVRFTKNFSVYGRGEYFKDQNELLTGPVLNEYHKLVGLHLWGATFGIEVKPIANSYLRFECRRIETQDVDEKVFFFNNKYSNRRDEFIAALGFWF